MLYQVKRVKNLSIYKPGKRCLIRIQTDLNAHELSDILF